MKLRLAIIGCGPWGLALLERLFFYFYLDKNQNNDIELHIIEPNRPGEGVYSQDLPHYLLLNTECGQIDLYAHKYLNPETEYYHEALSFYEWLRSINYLVDEYGIQREVAKTDYLPRKVLGEYLSHVYNNLSSISSNSNIVIHHHSKEAIDIIKTPYGENITLSDGHIISVNYVFLTIGHSQSIYSDKNHSSNYTSGVFLEPYPQSDINEIVKQDDKIALLGMGLTAFDILSCLTIGRGGYFKRLSSGKLKYFPSGYEPKIYMCSRNGTPFLSRPKYISDYSGEYKASFLTSQKIGTYKDAEHEIDFRKHILPLIFNEMQAAYSQKKHSDYKAVKINEDVNFEHIFWGFSNHKFINSEDYHQRVIEHIKSDINESKNQKETPLKFALEILRVLRDTIRLSVDFNSLSKSSFIDFHSNILPMYYRLVVGPPFHKTEELLSLIESGLVSFPFGPAPDISYNKSFNGWDITSTKLSSSYSTSVNHVIKGFIEKNNFKRTKSILMSNLFLSSRVTQENILIQTGCGINISRNFHPINNLELEEKNIFVLGLLTDGSRNFNLYIPSPKSRIRAFLDIDKCLQEIIRNQKQIFSLGVEK